MRASLAVSVFALLVALSAPAKSQQPSAAFVNVCSQLSQGNMRDTMNSISEEYKFSLLRRAILRTDFENYTEFQSMASKLGIDSTTLDGIFGLDASHKIDSQKFQQKMQTFKDEMFSLDLATANSRTDRSTISVVAANLIHSCLDYAKDVALRQQGLFIEAEPTDRDLRTWTIRVFRNLGGQTTDHRITLSPSDITCLYKGQRIILGTTNISESVALLECTKPNGRDTKSLTVSLSSTGASPSVMMIGTDEVAQTRIDAVKAEADSREKELKKQLAQVSALAAEIKQTEGKLAALAAEHDRTVVKRLVIIGDDNSPGTADGRCPEDSLVWITRPVNSPGLKCARVVLERGKPS